MRSTFTSIESARLIVPGLYFGSVSLLLFLALGFIYHDVQPSFWIQFLVFVFLSFVSGLTMYLRETPKRRRAFSENQPSQTIQNMARRMKGVEALSEEDARRIYFYLLNNHVPAPAVEKIFFFGAVYHIVVHVRRTTFWFAILASILIASFAANGIPLPELHALIILAVLLWIIYGLNVQYNKADRNMQENYKDQILWVDMNRELVEKTVRMWKR